MEAHNGISAKIVEEAGFQGIWGSGLSISASLGVRDNNEASWTQLLEILEFMSDATSIPILFDGDTGYGNFNNMRRLVYKLEQREIGGVCIEDKVFPKTNSFITGKTQPLADIEEFSGKIKAGKDVQKSDDFVIVARVEASIAGWGLDEAIKRAEAYRKAGADAILIHSALRDPSEVFSFQQEWANRLPVVIVPTKYYTTPTDEFRIRKFRTVIWANHLMRSAMTSMQETAKSIFTAQNLIDVENKIVPVQEVFRIQGASDYIEAEKMYLSKSAKEIKAIILAASRGMELGPLTKNIPKAMVNIGDKPLINHIANTYRNVEVKDIYVVRGYKKKAFNVTGLNFIDNDEYEDTQEVYSLYKAMDEINGNCIISYGDVLFKKHIALMLLESIDDFSIIVDINWKDSRNKNRMADYVTCSDPSSKKLFNKSVYLKSVTPDEYDDNTHGEWMGFLKLSKKGAGILTAHLKKIAKDPGEMKKMTMAHLLNSLIKDGQQIKVIYTSGHWLDVDSLDDVVIGSNF